MKHSIIRTFVGALCFASTSVFAQDIIPKELLDLDFQRCVNDCVPGFGEATCKPLCDCTVDEFQKRLNYAKYLELSVQLSRTEINPANRLLLDSIAEYCTAEIDLKGIKVGAPPVLPVPQEKPEK